MSFICPYFRVTLQQFRGEYYIIISPPQFSADTYLKSVDVNADLLRKLLQWEGALSHKGCRKVICFVRMISHNHSGSTPIYFLVLLHKLLNVSQGIKVLLGNKCALIVVAESE